MTVWDYFILGLGYGACALGIIMLLGVAFGLLVALCTAIFKVTDEEDADE